VHMMEVARGIACMGGFGARRVPHGAVGSYKRPHECESLTCPRAASPPSQATFAYAFAFNQAVGEWDVSSVTSLSVSHRGLVCLAHCHCRLCHRHLRSRRMRSRVKWGGWPSVVAWRTGWMWRGGVGSPCMACGGCMHGGRGAVGSQSAARAVQLSGGRWRHWRRCT